MNQALGIQQIERQRELIGTTHKGVILLGDISGYTKLLTELELEHARNIVFSLFDKIYAATGEHFLVNEIEGDAIFAFAINPTEPGQLIKETISQVESYGKAFYEAKEALAAAQKSDPNACGCGACSTIGALSFKFIVHYGTFSFNQIGHIVGLIGKSIIVAHRLLKNSVPSKSYVLLTKNALDLLPAEDQKKFTQIDEDIEHFGIIPIGYEILDWATV